MQDQTGVEYSSQAGCLARLYWMFLGNALLFILLAYLIQKHPEFPSLLDVGYLLTLASLVGVRYLDIRHLNGETGDGNAPATMSDWRKYALFLVTGCAAVWLALRVLAPLFMK